MVCDSCRKKTYCTKDCKEAKAEKDFILKSTVLRAIADAACDMKSK